VGGRLRWGGGGDKGFAFAGAIADRGGGRYVLTHRQAIAPQHLKIRLSEEVLIQPLDVERLFNAHAHVMLDHILSQELAID